MKFPKIFGKKKDDEDDDFDDDDELDEAVGEAPEIDASGDDEDDLDDDDHEADDLDAEDADEEMVGSDDKLDNPFDEEEGDDDEDYDDDDFDYDDEEEEASSRKKAIIFAAVGFGVLFLSIMGGVGWWFLSGPSTDTAEKPEKRPGVVEMAMPAAPGSLNAGGSGASLNSLSSGAPDTAQSSAQVTSQPTTASSSAASSESAEQASGETAFAVNETQPAGGLNSLNSLNSLGSSSAGDGLVIPAVAGSAMGRIPDQKTAADQSQALSSAPLKALLEEKDGIGELPKIASNGATSWQAYARPIDPSIAEPKIALMIENIGLSRQASLGAINKLPPEVSMALNPYARDLNDWVFRSRLAGHEVYMLLPMESEHFPLEDAGPLALDTRIQLAENQRRLDTVLASAGGYVGVVSFMGSRFLKAEGQLRQLLQQVKDRGLMFVTGGARSRNDAIPIAKDLQVVHMESEIYIDETPRIQQIRTALDRMESIAKDRGSVLVMARPYPVTIQSVLDWIATLKDKGVNLVPASAVATIPEAPQ